MTHGGRLVQMMERQGRDDHVDRPAPHRQVDGVPLEDDDLRIRAPQVERHARDRRVVVEGEEANRPADPPRPAHERARHVTAARAHVEHGERPPGGQRGGEPLHVDEREKAPAEERVEAGDVGETLPQIG